LKNKKVDVFWTQCTCAYGALTLMVGHW